MTGEQEKRCRCPGCKGPGQCWCCDQEPMEPPDDLFEEEYVPRPFIPGSLALPTGEAAYAQLATVTAERDQLHALVGIECPVGDLSIVDSLRAEAQHRMEHVAALVAEVRRLAIKGPILGGFNYDFTARCLSCGESWEARSLDAPERHKPDCLAIDTEGKAHGG